jgi:hypothetical protein
MDIVPKDMMIAREELVVNCAGLLIFPEKGALKKLGNQEEKENRWPEKWQPLTSAKATARNAWVLLNGYNLSMFAEHRGSTSGNIMVFVPEDVKAVEEAAMTGKKEVVLEAISNIKEMQFKNIRKRPFG